MSVLNQGVKLPRLIILFGGGKGVQAGGWLQALYNMEILNRAVKYCVKLFFEYCRPQRTRDNGSFPRDERIKSICDVRKSDVTKNRAAIHT